MIGITTKKSGTEAKQPSLPEVPVPLDVFENDKEYLVLGDLPGVSQGSAELTLDAGRLVISAMGAARQFRRELVVPPSVDPEGVTAAMKSGVLTLRLPKRTAYQSRQIPVRGD
jgi:HSP20 family protein